MSDIWWVQYLCIFGLYGAIQMLLSSSSLLLVHTHCLFSLRRHYAGTQDTHLEPRLVVCSWYEVRNIFCIVVAWHLCDRVNIPNKACRLIASVQCVIRRRPNNVCACSQQGTFGEGCNSICSCRNGGSCDPVTGHCLCPPGVAGDQCQDGCPPGLSTTHFDGKGKVKVNVDLYSASWTHLYAFSRDLTVLPAHPAFIR